MWVVAVALPSELRGDDPDRVGRALARPWKWWHGFFEKEMERLAEDVHEDNAGCGASLAWMAEFYVMSVRVSCARGELGRGVGRRLEGARGVVCFDRACRWGGSRAGCLVADLSWSFSM